MTSRIKGDKNWLKKHGYKNAKLIHDYTYGDDRVTVYTAKDKESKKYQKRYFFPTKLDPNVIWKQIEPEIARDKEILRFGYEFTERGILYNALCVRNDNLVAVAARYDPQTASFTTKEVEGDEQKDDRQGKG